MPCLRPEPWNLLRFIEKVETFVWEGAARTVAFWLNCYSNLHEQPSTAPLCSPASASSSTLLPLACAGDTCPGLQ